MTANRLLVRMSIFFCLFAVVSLTDAQNTMSPKASPVASNGINGIVSDENSGQYLHNVNVSLQGTNLGSATGPDGRFRIANVPAGEYTLVVSMIGFQTVKQTVVLSEGQTLELRFTLVMRPLTFNEVIVERTSLVGNTARMFKIPGSAHYLDAEHLANFEYNDIHHALAEVPGINIQEEDGYGLRPNIGFRGTGSERSSKITIMEDGVLQAPAPYSAPAAYYFPTVGRMSGIEVRKGSSQIKYGPFTTGGALNLLSTAIPDRFDGYLELLAGQDEHRRIHAQAGNASKNFGFLAETFQAKTDGFKKLDGGGNTGFDKKDYLLKLRFNTDVEARMYQQLSVKLSQTDEISDETYLGLTDADFSQTPLRRYAASQNDVINTDHTQLLIRHFIKPASSLDFTTSFYRTDFKRNWYKLDRIRATESGVRASIAQVTAEPETFAAEYDIATGQSSPNDNALEVKANNREYYAWGVQTQAVLQFNAFRGIHEAEFGIRYHEDQIDRFQWVDLYRMDSGVLELTLPGVHGTESNRLSDAKVWAGYSQLTLRFGRLTAVPGLRYENMRLTRHDFGTEDPERTGVNLNSRQNQVDVIIPGLGLDYGLSPILSSFFGVHKGFAPPGSRDGAKPEDSINYELGVRLNRANLNIQGVVFFNDYSNLLGSDLVASGGQGTGDQFNGGEVDAKGLELSLSYDLGSPVRESNLGIPFRAAYTYTRTEFKNGFDSEFEAWGGVTEGDELPYVPRHQLFASLGVQGARYSVTLGAKFNARMRTIAGQGDFVDAQSTDAHMVFDLAADFAITDANKLFITVRNLFNETYIAARRPAGARPGLPRTLLAGVKTNF